MTSQSVENYT